MSESLTESMNYKVIFKYYKIQIQRGRGEERRGEERRGEERRGEERRGEERRGEERRDKDKEYWKYPSVTVCRVYYFCLL